MNTVLKALAWVNWSAKLVIYVVGVVVLFLEEQIAGDGFSFADDWFKLLIAVGTGAFLWVKENGPKPA